MTAAIVDHDGVVADFQGDAVMGFWGWPLAHPDQIELAARAALAIRRRFVGLGDRPDHPLADLVGAVPHLPCGIGIAHGHAIVQMPHPMHLVVSIVRAPVVGSTRSI